MGARARIAALGLAAAAALVTTFEGYRDTTYVDVTGTPTACYGHTDPNLKLGQVFTKEACEQYLLADLLVAAKAVDRLIPGLPKGDTRNALISFTLNVGSSNLASSTLRKRFLAGRFADGCNEMRHWVYSKGQKLQGLVNRRNSESTLCLRGLNAL